MIRVLQVVPILGYGGVEKVVQNYYDVLDHNRFHFDYVTHGEVEEYHQRIMDQGSRIYYLPTIGSQGFFTYIRKIKEKIKIDEYDYIHIHTGDLTGLYAMAYRKAGARFIICHAHTAKAISDKRNKIEWLLRILANKESDFRMACGNDAGAFCFGRNRYMLLPNAINAKAFTNVTEDQINKVKRELKIEKDTYIVGHVGAFINQKNHIFLLELFAEALKKQHNMQLILVGDGPNRNIIEEKILQLQIKDNVVLCGIRNDINVIMHIFDLFVFPSLFEGLPVVGIEAQTAGVKCLFSDTIDRGVDIGCGLSTFLPIDQGTKKWSEALLCCKESEKPAIEKNAIELGLQKNGYSIVVTKRILEQVYQSNLKREKKNEDEA